MTMTIQDELDKARQEVEQLARILAAYPDVERVDGCLVATVPMSRCDGVRSSIVGGETYVVFGDEDMGVWSKAEPVAADYLLLTILGQEGGPEMIQRALDEITARAAK